MNEKEVEVLETIVKTEPPIAGQDNNKKEICRKCGAELLAGKTFCPDCGAKITQLPTESDKKTKKKPIQLIVGIAFLIVFAIAIALIVRGPQAKSITLNKESVIVKVGETITLNYTIDPSDTKNKSVTWSSSNESIAEVDNGTISGINEGDCTITVKTKNGKTDICSVVVAPAGPDLQAIYDEYCTSIFASVSSDGSYLSVDTNPFDIDGYSDSEALVAIIAINAALDLPESTLTRMAQTRALDGTQSYSTDEVELTWTYHPNHGLQVNYYTK